MKPGIRLAVLAALAAVSLAADISTEVSAQRARITNGKVTLVVDFNSGLADLTWPNGASLRAIAAAAQLEGLEKEVGSELYRVHRLLDTPEPVQDALGHGRRFTFESQSDGLPVLRRKVTFYDDQPFVLLQVELSSKKTIATNRIAVIRSSADLAGESATALHAPCDNDIWYRFDAVDLSKRGSGDSCEFTAVFDPQSRRGLVAGSVTHDHWKSALQFRGNGAKVDRLEVFGGILSPTGPASATHDSVPHGMLRGLTVSSPVIFAGAYDDWRDGLEAFGLANAAMHPPMISKEAIPFGWNSWAAYGLRIDYSRYLSAAQFLHDELAPHGFHSAAKVLYVNLDAMWSRFEPTQLSDAADAIRAIGAGTGVEFRPGIYMAPFGWWWPENLDAFVEGTGLKYRFRDLLLKDRSGNPLPKVDGGLPLDPTHPATLARAAAQLRLFRRLGFRYVKIDFLGHAALEGDYYDKSIHTGMEAYHQAMQFLLREAGPDMFVSLSIAPLFPGGYGHARRLSCDTKGHISGKDQSTEYMLNALTYGWWTNRSLYIADADHVVLGPKADEGARSVHEARSRFLSTVIAGGMILDSSPYQDDEIAKTLARAVYTSPALNRIAAESHAFRPVDAASGDTSADAFYRKDGDGWYLAVFNFDSKAAAKKRIALDRIAPRLAAGAAVTDVGTGQDRPAAGQVLTVQLEAAESVLLRLTPRPAKP